jgi:hypothetical protein
MRSALCCNTRLYLARGLLCCRSFGRASFLSCSRFRPGSVKVLSALPPRSFMFFLPIVQLLLAFGAKASFPGLQLRLWLRFTTALAMRLLAFHRLIARPASILFLRSSHLCLPSSGVITFDTSLFPAEAGRFYLCRIFAPRLRLH